MPTKTPLPKDSDTDRPALVPDSGPLPDAARTVSTIAGGATAGAIVGGPIGAVIGAGLGGVLGLVATGHLHRPAHH